MVFSPSETERLRTCLTRLLPHLSVTDVALTGGVAIELTLRQAGLGGSRPTVSDLDFVARRREAIDPAISQEFLVYHYHVPQPGYPKFLLMLVDPVSRIRVDFFPDMAGAVDRARPVSVASQQLLMLDAHSMLEHKLETVSKASDAHPVDIKHYEDAVALASVCGRRVPPAPSRGLVREVYAADLTSRCPRCDASRTPVFPLAPKRDILDVLGYV